MANNEWGDFQTPAELASLAVESIPRKPWGRLLEPTCGEGAFLSASVRLGPDIEMLGVEVQPHYAAHAAAAGFTVLERNIFDLDLAHDLTWSGSGPLLILGNPPWVTSAQLGTLGSINLPAKSNIRKLSGFDAMTGSSNFDIAEFILLKLMVELESQHPTISLLLKTQVARNVLLYAAQFGLPYSNFEIREIDAKAWFGASVDACLFTLEHSDSSTYECDVMPAIDSELPSHTIGVVGGKLVADVVRYKRTAVADGQSPVEWRSGVKHDAAAVMELPRDAASELGLEPDYLFPLLKCTDLFRGRLTPARYMVVPQHSFGEDTAHLEQDAPALWRYLHANAHALDSRGSSIYRKQPRFTVFGLGDYTFAPFKIAISGLHKEVRFVLLGQFDGRPIVVDDASYTLSFGDGLEASMCYALLTSEPTIDLLKSLVFWDAKRPISKKLLQRVDLAAVARVADDRELSASASEAARGLGLAVPRDWSAVSERLLARWAEPAPKARRQRATRTGPRASYLVGSAPEPAWTATGRLFD
jgi:hypothetical protein